MGCHGDQYEMYIDIVSYNVSANFNEDVSRIQCNVSFTGNINSFPTNAWKYYDANITVSATTTYNLLSIQSPSKKFFFKRPGFSATVNFTVQGADNGTETIKLEAKLEPAHKNATCTRIEIRNVQTRVTINVPPFLSNGKVTPMVGSAKMDYVFEVKYQDLAEDVPTFVRCTIDGIDYPMLPKDGVLDTLSSGEIFTVTVNGSIIGQGSNHRFNFSASDNKYLAVGDINQHTGPNIEALDYKPICNITYPTSGILSGSLNITGTSFDPDPTDSVSLVEVSLRDGGWLIANGTDTWHLEIDLFKHSDGPMSIRARAIANLILSDIDQENIDVDNSFSNSLPSLVFDFINDTVVAPLIWINGSVWDPELPTQEVAVYFGLGPIPKLQTNVTFNGSDYTWSIFMNLSDQKEGILDLYALAADPYAESMVNQITVILDIPNIPPSITLDEFTEPLWGPVNFSGIIKDVDDEVLKVNISIDDMPWREAYITYYAWNFTYNFSRFTEEDHILHLMVDDGENQVMLNRTITVLGPYNVPIIIQTTPSSLVTIPMEQNITFRALYRAGDHRGTTVQWYVDSVSIDGITENNNTELDVYFNNPGNYKIMIEVLNAEDSTLRVTFQWTVNARLILKLEPQGGTEINTMVGEVVILKFDVTLSEPKEITWTVDGVQVPSTGASYLSYLPNSAGNHTIVVTVQDNLENIENITYSIYSEETEVIDTIPESKTTEPQDETRRMGQIIIVLVFIALIIVILYAIAIVVRAVRKSKRRAEPARVPSPAAVTIQPQMRLATTQVQPTMMAQPVKQQYNTPITQQTQSLPQYSFYPTPATSQPVAQPVIQQPTQQPILPPQMALQSPQPSYKPSQQPSYQPTQPIPQQQLQFQPQQPVSNVCPRCYKQIEYIPGRNAYWCGFCKQYVQPSQFR
jgi:hypothetical protein